MDHETNVSAVFNEDIIWMTTSFYSFFLAHGKEGMEGKELFEHYQYTARLQGTNSVWACDSYVRKGLRWGADKLARAKRFLLKHGLIAIKQDRDENNRFTKVYIVIKTKRTPSFTAPGTLVSGYRETENKCLKGKDKCLKGEMLGNAASGAPVPKKKDKLRLSPIIPKRQPPPILPETEQLLAAWNALSDNPDLIVRPSRHKPGTGIISKIDQYVRILLSGKQKTELPLLQSWVTRSNLPTELLTKRFTVEDLLEGIRIHALHFQPDHWPFEASQKKSIPRSLEKALYSDNGKRTSWILFSLFAAAPKKKEAVKNPEAVKVLSNIVTRENNRPLKHSEEQQISTSADAIVAWHKRLAAGPLPYVLWYWMDIHTVEKFLNIFSAAIVIIQRERTIDIHPAMLRPGTVTWETFLTYLANEKKIDLTGYGEDPFEWVPQIVGAFNRARKVVEAMGPEKYHHIMTRRKEYPRFYLSEEVKEKVKKEYMEKLKAGKTKDKSFTQYALRKICKGEINVHR